MTDKRSSKLVIWQGVRRWAAGFVACTLIALFLSTQWFFNPSIERDSGEWTQIVGHYLVICYIWGLLTIGIVAITARAGLDRRRWLRSGLTYLLVGIAFSIAHFVASIAALHAYGLMMHGTLTIQHFSIIRLLGSLQSNLILFTVITSVCLALSYYRKYQDRELRATRLEAQLAQAQLDALKSQLQPHFLFNTLNAISALVRDNPETAERMIVGLSDLLRKTLDNVGREEVTLRDELEFIHHYLEIEQIRFGDRLVLDERLEPGTQQALVPTLILQPLVENAMHHGVAAVSSACQVTISASRSNSRLCLEVSDTGPGLRSDEAARAGGLGIANTVNRLRHLYGDKYDFAARNREGGGFSVRVEIPFHEATNDPSHNGGRV